MKTRYRNLRKFKSIRKRENGWLSRAAKIAVFLWSAVLIVLFFFTHGDQGAQSIEPDATATERGSAIPSGVEEGASGGEVALRSSEHLPFEKLQNGEGIAFVNGTSSVVDRRGRLLKTGLFPSVEDLPVLTCRDVKIELKKMRVTSADVLEALEFLSLIKRIDLPLFYQISQVDIDEELGTVAYFDLHLLPVIIGHGHIKRKVAYLATVIRHIEGREDLGRFKYLDLRLDGQVIAKLNGE